MPRNPYVETTLYTGYPFRERADHKHPPTRSTGSMARRGLWLIREVLAPIGTVVS